MRIISGRFRGRRFHPPAKSWPTRPTTDYAKEGLFNILTNQIDFSSIVALDLFGGTGNHTFELISRGCLHVTYVDNFRPCCLFVRQIAREMQISDSITIDCKDVARFIRQEKTQYNYIFAGPPYPLKWLPEIAERILDTDLLLPDGLLVVEHNAGIDFSSHFAFTSVRRYGDTHFSFFERQGEN